MSQNALGPLVSSLPGYPQIGWRHIFTVSPESDSRQYSPSKCEFFKSNTNRTELSMVSLVTLHGTSIGVTLWLKPVSSDHAVSFALCMASARLLSANGSLHNRQSDGQTKLVRIQAESFWLGPSKGSRKKASAQQYVWKRWTTTPI